MIKNIIFDIDGVLTNLDFCYFNFLRKTYKAFENIKYEDLPVLFPIHPDDGAFELPSRFSGDFANSPYYCERPVFEGAMDVLHSLKKKGINLFTLSAAADPAKKLKWLEGVFVNIFNAFEFSPIGISKDKALIGVLEKYSLDKDETIFIDDRFFNIKSGLRAGVHTVRMQPEFNLPLPEELSDVKSFKSLTAFEKYIDDINNPKL